MAEDHDRALAAAKQRIKALEAALAGLVGLYDDPTPYDSATTITAARAALTQDLVLVKREK